MGALGRGCVLAALAVTLGCTPKMQSDASALLTCAFDKYARGVTDPVQIAEQCPGAEIALVTDIIHSLEARAALVACSADAGPVQRSPASAGGR